MLSYIHNVSLLKQSRKTSYFTAELQTSANHVVRALLFSPKKRTLFSKHQNEKSPVKISKFKISTREGSDIIINNNTAMSPAKVSFSRQEICASTLSTISSLQNVSLEQMVNLHSHVWQLSRVKMISSAGRSLKKREGVLIDETNSIKVILWENHVDKLEEGRTYNLRNLQLKESHGDKYVNTPKTGEFTCEAAAELDHLADNHHIDLQTVHSVSSIS